MAGRTRRFGLSFFGGSVGGSLGEDAGKFTGQDRRTVDSVLATLESHDHLYHPALPDPTGQLTAEVDVNGSLPAGKTYHYTATFIDSNGLESVANDEVSVSTPALLPRPAMPSAETIAGGGALPSGLYYYAITALRGTEESVLSQPVSVRVFAGETVVVSPPVLGDATSYRVWRMGSTESGYTKIGTTATGILNDVGAVPSDPCACDPGNLPPTVNRGVSKYSVIVALDSADSAALADAAVVAWRLYRTETSGVYSASSLVHEIVELQNEANPASGLLTAWEDVGDALTTGTPPLYKTSLDIPVFTLDSAASLPPIAGYPENYPIVVSGTLYISDAGEWKAASGGSGGGGGTVPGTTTVRVGQTTLSDAEALESQKSVVIGDLADIEGGAVSSVVMGYGAKAFPAYSQNEGYTEDCVALGAQAEAAESSVAVGGGAYADGSTSVAVGSGAYGQGYGTIVIGGSAAVQGDYETLSSPGWAESYTVGNAGDGTVVNGTYRGVVRDGSGMVRLVGPQFIVSGVDPNNGSITFNFTLSNVAVGVVSPFPLVEIYKVESLSGRGEGSYRATLVGSATPVGETSGSIVVTTYEADPRLVWIGGFSSLNYAMAIGSEALVENYSGGLVIYGPTALGGLAQASADSATALGYEAQATAASSTALGASAVAGHARSTAVGRNAQTTADDQIMLGTTNVEVVAAGGRVELGTAGTPAVLGIVSGTTRVGQPITAGGTDYVDMGAVRKVSLNSTTTRTLALTDAGSLLQLSNASANTLTVPPNSTVAFPVGTTLELAQMGAGQTTVAPGAAVTLRSTPGLKIAAQYGVARLTKIATDEWLVSGNLVA